MIEFDHVSMAYHQSTELALKNVSFQVARGEFVFIIGSSGSGKSTIIKLLTCEEKPLKGEVLVNGFSLNTMKKKQIPYLRRNIGMVFQDFRLIPSKTVFENVAYAMEIVGASKKAIKRQVPMVLSIVGLRNRANAHPNELSGGEQQRVAIARAMVNKPMMILADEPTGNLDPANSESIMALLQEINRNGTTVLVCTHDKELVDRMKRRVILIDDGMKLRDEADASFYGEDATSDYLLPDATCVSAEQAAILTTEEGGNESLKVSRIDEQQAMGGAKEAFRPVFRQAHQAQAGDEQPKLRQQLKQSFDRPYAESTFGEEAAFGSDLPLEQLRTGDIEAEMEQADNWRQFLHNRANEEVADGEADVTEEPSALADNKKQKSNLSAERMQRWGKRRF